jgi:hypothetical protein
MKKITLTLFLFIGIINFRLSAQNVGINTDGSTPDSKAMLDVKATGSGFLMPRMAWASRPTGLTSTQDGLIIYSTDGDGTNGAGFYYYKDPNWLPLMDNKKAWNILGNSGTTASSAAYGSAVNNNFFGTTDNKAIVFAANNLERMRINPTDGEVVIGAQTSGLVGDALCAVSNSGLPWAVNGYSAQNGGGVYGSVTSGTTNFSAVQGEYFGTGLGNGVYGSYMTDATSGTSFTFGQTKNGVAGNSFANGNYRFGVHGIGGLSTRSGGVIGNDGDFRWGACGYFANNSTDYSLYGFGTAVQTGTATGRVYGVHTNGLLDVTPNNQVGLGVYGGVMGGWIKGLVYGTNFSGQKYGIYVHGDALTNNKFIQLNDVVNSEKRVPSYATTSLTHELIVKGKAEVFKGEATIILNTDLRNICDLSTLIVSVTPLGESNGVFIKNITDDFITIKENNSGNHDFTINYIISGTVKNSKPFDEINILDSNYEKNMDGVMHNDIDTSNNGTPIWFDGKNVRHDAVDNKLIGRDKKIEEIQKQSEKLSRSKK